MRTKHLIALAAIVAATTYATSAQAGVSFQISLGWPAPVFVEPTPVPVCAPQVILAPPRPVYRAPVVVVRQPYVPVCAPVRIPPGHAWNYGRPGKYYAGKPHYGYSPRSRGRH